MIARCRSGLLARRAEKEQLRVGQGSGTGPPQRPNHRGCPKTCVVGCYAREEWLVRRLQVATTERLGGWTRMRSYAGWLSLAVFVAWLVPALAQSGAPPLSAYNADIKESSISGISSGAFMAVQFGVSWSSIIKGVGVIAGGPYYCAQGKAIDGLVGNLGPVLSATGPCMKGPPPDLKPLFEKTDEWARSRDIDDPHDIANQRIYI